MNPEVEKYRHEHPLGFPQEPGADYGWFEIPGPCGVKLYAMASPKDGDWYHVSISKLKHCPNWTEMCFIKDLFFEDEDVVVQFHPKKSEYVNNAKNCLHLWKWNGGEFPTPPADLVGV